MGIRAHVEKCIMQDKKPDVIIVDYADLLRGHGQEKRHELEGIYEDLRGLAGEYEIPVWTASQANRSALEEDVIDEQEGEDAPSGGGSTKWEDIVSLTRGPANMLDNTPWSVSPTRGPANQLT